MKDLSQLIQDVINGDEDPLKAYAILKNHEKTIKAGLAEIWDYVEDEAKKYGEKNFEHGGYKFELKNGRKVWNFKTLPDWNAKKAELTAVEARAKAAWDAYQKGVTGVDADTGEITELPEVTYTKDSLTVKSI